MSGDQRAGKVYGLARYRYGMKSKIGQILIGTNSGSRELRKLGMIGGMSWVSTRRYYEHLNTIVQRRVSPRSSAPLLIDSLNFDPLYRIADDVGWAKAAETLIASARGLVAGGAEGLIVCANSMHRVYRELEDAVDVPIIHIADCVAEKMEADGVKTAALIGTRNVMTEGFYRRRLIERGMTLLPPDTNTVDTIDKIIYEELMLGKATKNAERTLKSILTIKEKDGADAIVLACTELEMIVDTDANILPVYDSTRIHAQAAAEWMLSDEN